MGERHRPKVKNFVNEQIPMESSGFLGHQPKCLKVGSPPCREFKTVGPQWVGQAPIKFWGAGYALRPFCGPFHTPPFNGEALAIFQVGVPAVPSCGAAMLSGGWVSGCGCGGAPVPVVLGTGGSNPPQVCEQPPRDACTHTSS